MGQYLDAIEIPEAISEKYLDRNGILCDNILELMPYMCSVLVNMAKDPACTDTEEGIPWWAWIFVGIGSALAIASLAVFTIGALGSLASVVVGAVKNTILGFLSGAITSSGISAFSQGLENGWGNINIGQVLIDGISGAFNGAFMASPFSPIITGTGVGFVGFTQYIISDAYADDWNFSNVRWGNASVVGLLSGLISGVGKHFISIGRNVGMHYDAMTKQTFPAVASLVLIGEVFSKIINWLTAGLRGLIRTIFD